MTLNEIVKARKTLEAEFFHLKKFKYRDNITMQLYYTPGEIAIIRTMELLENIEKSILKKKRKK